jgi:hypothetical protein
VDRARGAVQLRCLEAFSYPALAGTMNPAEAGNPQWQPTPTIAVS